MKVGIGLRTPYAAWIRQLPAEIDVLEITAEHFFEQRPRWLTRVARHYPILLHGLSLSLGSMQPLDPEKLERWRLMCDWLQPQYVTEHASFVESETIGLGHLSPIPWSQAFVRSMSQKIDQWQSCCQRQVLLENITSHLVLPGEMGEPEFLNEVCQKSGCGVLLDITNLYVNSQNHQFDPYRWLDRLALENVKQIHLVGFHQTQQGLEDFHNSSIQPPLYALLEYLLERVRPEYVIVERDSDIPSVSDMIGELMTVRSVVSSALNKRKRVPEVCAE